MKKNWNNLASGYTLVEILVVVSIFLLASTMILSFVKQGFQVNRFVMEQSDAIRSARKGMEYLIKEIREASPAENGSFPIDTADDQNLIFYSDIDSDELVERVRYYLDGTNLMKGIIEPSGFPPVYTSEEQTKLISPYVRNGATPIFYYYNGDYPQDTENNPLPTPAQVNNIKLIRMLLQVNLDPAQAPESFILISNSQIRNLKNNL